MDFDSVCFWDFGSDDIPSSDIHTYTETKQSGCGKEKWFEMTIMYFSFLLNIINSNWVNEYTG